MLVNGTPIDFFQSSRRLRQEDPLSPYLFVISLEALSSLLVRAQEGGFLSGFKVRGRGGDSSREASCYLLFANDTIVFYGLPWISSPTYGGS